VGGDFYDFYDLPGQPARLGVLVADVADKGVPAALFMALSRTIIRTTALSGRGPASALTRANELIRKDTAGDVFLSAAYAVLELDNGRVAYVNAGHNRPLWYRAATQDVVELRARGVVMGILEDIRLDQQRLDMGPGDVLVLYTDGLTEALNAEEQEFGKEAVMAVLAAHAGDSAQAIQDALMAALSQFTGDAEPGDDITCVVVKRA
jgi:sigma-B regulation protein RsbU (phosphoserine phosphatase)